MESRSKRTTNGTSRSNGSVRAVLFLAGMACCSTLLALPPPTIQPAGRPPALVVLDVHQPSTFPEQGWKINAPNPLIPTIAYWNIEPFRNLADHSIQVDAQLNLRVLSSGKSRSWLVLIPAARTQSVNGRVMAQVVAASVGGHGEAGITVSFLGHEQPFIADGMFETTVTGTITEAF